MKNTYKIISFLCIVTVFLGCKKDKIDLTDFSAATWSTTEGQGQGAATGIDYYKNVGDYVSFDDLSQNAVSHTWKISGGDKFLKPSFKDVPDLSVYINSSLDSITTDANAHVLFLKAGISDVVLTNTFKDSVNFYGEVLIPSIKKGDVYEITRTWKVDVFDSIQPAVRISYKDSLELFNSSTGFMPVDSILNIESGSTLTFENLTTVGRPNKYAWNIVGSKEKTATTEISDFSFLKLGTTAAGSFAVSRVQSPTVPLAKAVKYTIPLKINIIPSTKPFYMVANSLKDIAPNVISFDVTGQIAAFTGQEGFFKVHATNTGFDQDIAVTKAAVSSGSLSSIELTLAGNIYNTDNVTVSFVTGGVINSLDSRTFTLFTDEPLNFSPNIALASNFTGFETATPNGPNAYKNAFASGFWVGNPNQNPTNPTDYYYQRTTDEFNSGTASMEFQSDVPLSNTLSLSYTNFLENSSDVLSAGTYKMSMYVLNKTGLKSIKTAVRGNAGFIDSYPATWDISAVPIGTWTKVSQSVTIDSDITTKAQFQIFMLNSNGNETLTGTQEIYFDDVSFEKLEDRP